MVKEIYSQITGTLSNRREWEDLQATYYKMRRTGLRRKRKPFPTAADMHFPLADTIIDKQKPYFWKQLFSGERLATFLSWKELSPEEVGAAEKWFDYKVKHASNLPKKSLTLIDHMLESGMGILKTTWSAEEKRLEYAAIDPVYFIVPEWTTEIQKADWVVQVHHLSEAAYKRRTDLKQDAEFIKLLLGAKDETQKTEAAYRRAGITYSDRGNIILWEVWKRCMRGTEMDWQVEWVAAHNPELVARSVQFNPYKHRRNPFTVVPFEIADEGHYKPRGICNLVAPFQSALVKNWNDKLDAMSYYNRPIYTHDGTAETKNLTMQPGLLIGGNVQAVPQGAPPISFDQESINTRMIAEQRAGTPDYGVGQQINTRERRTASEVGLIAQQAGNVSDLRGDIFGMAMKEVFELSWLLLLQYDKDLGFFSDNTLGKVEQSALHQDYLIVPNIAAELNNKGLRIQTAGFIYDKTANDPFVDPGERTRYLLEEMAPRVARRLWRNPEQLTAVQAEDQALEICALEAGYPMQVKESDDHLTHFNILWQRIEDVNTGGAVVTQRGMGRLVEHGLQHLAALKKTNPQAFAEIMQQVGPQLMVLQSALSPEQPTAQEASA